LPVVLLIVLLARGPACAEDPAGQAPLRVAAVQFSIHVQDLASFSAYRARIEALVESCLAYEPDLILFPEYTSAFLAIVPYGARLARFTTVGQALRDIMAAEPLVASLPDLFLLNSGVAERAARELFARLARRHRVAIGAGTLFAADRQPGGTRLVNRALLFDQEGELLHAQDKVLLTDFEAEILGVEAGRLEQAAPFVFENRRIGLTICRDTYLADWERSFAGCDLWVDLKANGEPFTEQARESFQRALPARLAGAEVPYGLTVCLTGRLFELAWEGESFLAGKGPDGKVRTVVRAASARGEEVLLVVLPAR
jgi:predicted amidohydrolase